MRKWKTGNNPSTAGISRAWHKTCRTTSFAPPGRFVHHFTSKPYSPARVRAVWTPPRTSLTGFATSLPNPPQRASPLRFPTTHPGFWCVSRSSYAKWCHCGRNKHAAAHIPQITAAAPDASGTPHLVTTSDSGTKRENAFHHAPTSR